MVIVLIYVTKKCGKCKNTIVFRKSGYMPQMGNPFIKCPKCGTWQVDGEYKEYLMWKKKDYIKYFAYRLAGNLVFSMIITVIVIFLIGNLFNIKDNLFEITFFITFILIFILFALKTYHSFIKDKEDSMKRLEDKKYLELLYISKLISYEKYNEFIKNKNIDSE